MELQASNTDVHTGFKRILLCVDPTAASARATAFVPHLAIRRRMFELSVWWKARAL
ncbi:hypothetical protein LJR034_004027 [Caballeronia sp. LjRoot34]|uniref:hypothetical protein n=1 Tax=Caballeronia sp. LjRoot34 TaxID=3342325 RepID=UPI003ECF2C9D